MEIASDCHDHIEAAWSRQPKDAEPLTKGTERPEEAWTDEDAGTVDDTTPGDDTGTAISDLQKAVENCGSGWAIIPGDRPRTCCTNLVVPLLSNRQINDVLCETFDYLVSCRDTSSVLFCLNGFLPGWEDAWVSNRHRLEAILAGRVPRDTRFRVRVAQRHRQTHHSFLLADGTPAGCRDLVEWWDHAGPERQHMLRSRVLFLKAHGLDDYNCSFVGGYTHQPHGPGGTTLNAQPALTFGRLAGQGINMQTWDFRIYLKDDEMPVGVSSPRLGNMLQAAPQLMNGGAHGVAPNNAWVARDTAHFLARSRLYLP
jgi:hypothetical protein